MRLLAGGTVTDLHQARRFLRLLDPEAAEFTFQTFGEGRSKDAAELRCIRHGSFDKLAEELVALNNSGTGIFVTVNETDLKGRQEGKHHAHPSDLAG